MDNSVSGTVNNYMSGELAYACNTDPDLALKGGPLGNWGVINGADFSELQKNLVKALTTALEEVRKSAAYVKLV
jgi:hypothetical protein